MDDRLADNRAHWEELAALHPDTAFYDVESFLDGESTLRPLEREELGGRVGEGTRLLHLQCHFGLDTLSWARHGADVTGADFSETAVETARDLARETGLAERARFVEGDLYDLPAVLDEAFDVVFTSYGVLNWLPDIEAWADVVGHFLTSGGTFYVAEIHPFSHVLMDLDLVEGRPVPDWSYFGGDPRTYDEDGTYADREAELDDTVTHEWAHGLGEVVTALVDAGLDVEFVREHPFACFEQFPGMEHDEDGYWWLPEAPEDVPLTFSLRARG
ncbi:class I SAM-dependent methyltransferase [Halomarina ordinaria]|uniref:Class I SAM-dependent methyltransferase n=1 Tax=Halomarina ordinaria TaxID=3033939 RepID=A0ABD5U5E5_9EURY|nr:class I SAM-dependent methyltransferase [Halomarina sp. PSRA2]